MVNETALFKLGSLLRESDYHFTTITPTSHARVVSRGRAADATGGQILRDVFGWSRPFRRNVLPDEIFSLLDAANALEAVHGDDSTWRSLVRFSTLAHTVNGRSEEGIYVHSAYPTERADSVFFGPDTYRFVSLIEQELASRPGQSLRRVVDIGCGGGAGGISAAMQGPDCELWLTDINPVALQYANVNSRLAGLSNVFTTQSNLFNELSGSFDLIVANPPYLIDPAARVYRNGGGNLGSGLSTRIVEEGLPRLAPNGMLILYTGAPVVHGEDVFLASVQPFLRNAKVEYTYSELDPDVFGEELDSPGYENVERIAAVGLVVHNSAHREGAKS